MPEPVRVHEAPAGDGLGPALEELCRTAFRERWLLAFDFDGTLAPIARRPEGVRLPEGIARQLGALARQRPVAVLSGRALDDLRPRLPAGILALGNHGGEGLPGFEAEVRAARRQVETWFGPLSGRFRDHGRWVEDKGLSLTLHWREAQDREGAETAAADLVRELSPVPRLIPGHLALNCLPPGLPDKGAALAILLDRLGLARALFVGDDWTDAAVFTCGDPRIEGIQVGHLPLGARWRLPDQTRVAGLLAALGQEAGA